MILSPAKAELQPLGAGAVGGCSRGAGPGWGSALIAMLLLLAGPDLCVAAESREAARAAALLGALVGAWEGEAVRTPRGVLPYDIDFRRGGDGAVAGVANPGAALHHWRFFVEQRRLRLRFLTTFGGNTQPVWLTAYEFGQDATRFRADRPAYLELRVAPSAHTVAIDVLLRGEPHVDIRLTRRPSPLEHLP